MTYDAAEQSVQDGKPVELFEFIVGAQIFRFTTAAIDIVHTTGIYTAAALQRSEFEAGAEVARNDITIRCAPDFQITQYYVAYPPSDVILLRIYRLHRTDPDQERKPLWIGRVTNCEWLEVEAQLSCENRFTSLKRPGLRRLCARSCPHVLYGEACGAQASLHRVSVTVESLNGRTVNASALDAYDDGRFAGGLVEWEAEPGRIEKRAIKSHTGGAIELTHPISGMEAGATLLVYKGCRHNIEDCEDEFDRRRAYGGFPYIPQRNPYGSNGAY